MRHSLFLLAACAVSSSAHAYYYVWIDGQTTDLSSGMSYSQYLQDSNVTIFSDQIYSSPSFASATFGSSSTVGTLKAYATIGMTGVFQNTTPDAWGRSQYRDVVTVGGSGSVTLKVTMPTTGILAPNSADSLGFATLEVYSQSNSYAYLNYRVRMNNGVFTQDGNTTMAQFSVPAGTQLFLSGYCLARARLNWQSPTWLSSGTDFGHTSHTYLDVLTPGGNIAAQSGHDYSTPAATATVSGTITLQEFVGNVAAETVTMEVRSSAGILLATVPNVALGAGGLYAFTSPVTGTGIRITARGRTWLMKQASSLALNPGQNTIANITLPNGDADRSGEVDAADIDQVIGNFGEVSTGGPYNRDSDLDGSGEVDAGDLDTAIANFGLTNDF